LLLLSVEYLLVIAKKIFEIGDGNKYWKFSFLKTGSGF